MRSATSADFVSEIPAGRLARTQMTPSSSWGRNSEPSELPRMKAPKTTTMEAATTVPGLVAVERNTPAYFL